MKYLISVLILFSTASSGAKEISKLKVQGCDPTKANWTGPSGETVQVAELGEKARLEFTFQSKLSPKGTGKIQTWVGPEGGLNIQGCHFAQFKKSNSENYFILQLMMGAHSAQLFIFRLKDGSLAHESPRSTYPVEIGVEANRFTIDYYVDEFDPQAGDGGVSTKTYYWP